jgi:cobalt-zinc-cadmium efflux system protein
MTHGHDHSHGVRSRRALAVVLALIAGFTVVEAVGGFLTDSLALLADAGHMLGDSGALALALFAAWLASRPATPDRSFGYRRAEILAALANGLALVAIAIWVFVEAIRRLTDPPEVLGGWMLVVGLVGLVVNIVAAGILSRFAGESLNVQAALRHVLADVAGSVGVAVAALVVLTTGWEQADPLAGMAIALLILASSWAILRDSVAILLEATPAGVDAGEVGQAMAAVEGVVEVHDLHIWTITSGFPALSAHVLVRRGGDCHGVRLQLEQLLAREFDLDHTTLQVEHVGERSGLQIAPLRLAGRVFRAPQRDNGS